jgi:hypothetical protein
MQKGLYFGKIADLASTIASASTNIRGVRNSQPRAGRRAIVDGLNTILEVKQLGGFPRPNSLPIGYRTDTTGSKSVKPMAASTQEAGNYSDLLRRMGLSNSLPVERPGEGMPEQGAPLERQIFGYPDFTMPREEVPPADQPNKNRHDSSGSPDSGPDRDLPQWSGGEQPGEDTTHQSLQQSDPEKTGQRRLP